MIRPTVFLVEDDKDLRVSIGGALAGNGYDVVEAASVGEFLNILKTTSADIIVLDLGLPDGNGLDQMAEIRKKTNAPIIIVSGKGETIDRIVGLEMGADDYLGKPFTMRELTARIKANLRQSQRGRTQSERIKFGRWILDRGKLQVFDGNNRSASLTTSEFRLLEALVMAPNRVLSRAQILDMVRAQDMDVLDRTVDIHITRIRRKLKDSGRGPGLIKTVRGAGYMFVAETVNA